MKVNKFTYFVLSLFVFFQFFFFILPFLFSTLYNWDTTMHYYYADYYTTTLFPRFVGWNPYLLGGYPHGQFYQPLFYWLVGGLGRIITTEIAFKLILSISLLLIPLSFVFLLKRLKLSDLEQAISLSLLFLFMCISSFLVLFPGGDFISTFFVGNISNAFALPFLFLYVGMLIPSIKKETAILPSIILAFLILAHILVAIIAILSFVILFCFFLFENHNKYIPKIKFAFQHSILTFFLLGFWIVPLITSMSYSASPPAGLFVFNVWFDIVILVVALFSFVFVKTEKAKIPFVILVSLLVFLILGPSFAQKIGLPLWRFQFYPIIFLSILLSIPLAKLLKNRIKKIKLSYSIIFILLPFILIFSAAAHPPQIEDMRDINFDLPKLQNRIGIIFDFNPSQTLPIFIRTLYYFPAWSHHEVTNGFLVYSNRNADFINFMKLEIDNEHSDIEESRISLEDLYLLINGSKEKIFKLLPYHLKYYGTSHILTNVDKQYIKKIFGAIPSYDINITKYKFELYTLGDNNIFEILNYTPKKVVGDWDKGSITQTEQWRWFLDPKRIGTLITPDDLPDWIGKGNETIEVLIKEPEYIKLKVNSALPVPVHIKIPYYPNWNIYVNGKKTEIYRIPINMMLIYGNGIVELKYESITADYIGYALTLIGIGYLIYKRKQIMK